MKKFVLLYVQRVWIRVAIYLGSALVLFTESSSVAYAAKNARQTGDRSPSNSISDAIWETDLGTKLRLADLQGQAQVVSLFYSSCHVTCPMTLMTMKQVEAALPAEVRSQVSFVLITFLPDSDSTQALHRFRGLENLSTRWTLLRGSEAATRKAADVLGVPFSRGSYRFAHSPQIAVIDSKGRIVYRERNLRNDPHPIVSAVRTAIATKVETGS